MEPTDIQKSIIEYDGNAVVLASPGSGKTFVLSNMIRRILRDESTLPYQGVIAISYTRKASANLKNRALGETDIRKNSFFGTIDNFCLTQIVENFGNYIFGHPSKTLCVVALSDLEPAEKMKFDWIETLHPNYDSVTPTQMNDLANLFRRGEVLVESLELLALHIMLHCAACCAYIRARYTYILIDEYQDTDTYTNQLFLKMVDLGLTGVAVGDENQSIFGFAHKNSQYLKNLKQNPNFQSFVLSDNFRCSMSIINYSNRVLDPNSKIINTDDEGVILVRVNGDECKISEFMDQYIGNICKGYGIENLSDVAILVKRKDTQWIINSALQTPHRIIDTTTLDMDLNPRSRLFTYLLRFYFDKTMPFISILDEYIDYEQLSIHMRKRLKEEGVIIRSISGEDIMDLLHHFDAVADLLFPNIEKGASLQKLEKILQDEYSLNTYKPISRDEVQLMTLHKSKGLEFDLVFLLGMNEWEFPAKRPVNGSYKNTNFNNWDQDLDLHYVGLTRAKKACIMVKSRIRTKSDGNKSIANDSEFLNMNNLASLRRECYYGYED